MLKKFCRLSLVVLLLGGNFFGGATMRLEAGKKKSGKMVTCTDCGHKHFCKAASVTEEVRLERPRPMKGVTRCKACGKIIRLGQSHECQSE